MFALACDSESLNGSAMSDRKKCRSFCFPILDIEHPFLTFISHPQKLFKECNMKMWKEKKGKEEISYQYLVYIFVLLLFVPVK